MRVTWLHFFVFGSNQSTRSNKTKNKNSNLSWKPQIVKTAVSSAKNSQDSHDFGFSFRFISSSHNTAFAAPTKIQQIYHQTVSSKHTEHNEINYPPFVPDIVGPFIDVLLRIHGAGPQKQESFPGDFFGLPLESLSQQHPNHPSDLQKS